MRTQSDLPGTPSLGATSKRILFLGYSAQPGGAELQMLSLINRLDGARFKALVALAEDGPLSVLLRNRSEKVFILPTIRPLLRGVADRRSFASNIVALLPAVLALRRLILEEKVDLIHAYAEPTIKHAAILRRLTGRPTVCSFFEANLPARNRMHRRGLVAALSHGVDRIISPSRVAATSLIEAGIAAAKVTVLHHGVDLAKFAVTEEKRVSARRDFGIGNDETVVVLAARFTRMKGHDVLLRALHLLRERGCRIRTIMTGKPLFAGEREWLEEVAGLLQTLGLEDRVRLVGWLDDLAPLYAACDIVVHPCTLADTLPLAVLEAMAAGRPVIASRIGGLPELVSHDQTGLLVEPGNHVALADAIGELIAQPQKAAEYGIAARRRAECDFDDSRYASAIMNIYDRLLCKP